MEGAPAAGEETFELLGGGAVVLHETGFRHPEGLFRRERFTPYAELTHLALGARGLRVATRSGAFTVHRRAMRRPVDLLRLAGRLRERALAAPGGAERAERFAALDRRLAARRRPRLARALVAACLVVFALQWLFFPRVELAGAFNGDLVRSGELWRLVTANFLHGGLAHLALNALGLLVLGALLEAMLGFQAAAFVAAASALGAMGGSLVADYFQALGASGIVAGVVGALLFEEFRRPERIPAPWRLSRGLLVGAIAADTVLLAFLPGIAHAAHLGGFGAGLAAAAAVTPRDPLRPARPAWLGAANLGAVGIASASALALVWAVWGPGPGAVRARAERLLVLEGVHPQILNNEAWMIAVSESPDPELLAVARRMAERAVEATGRRDPNVLDTLAEVQFAAGDASAAVATIDEAIALAPHVDYFEEQRRRFTGERAADDRPEPPDGPIEPLPLPDPETSPGIRVRVPSRTSPGIRVRVPSPVTVAGADGGPGALRG